MTFSTLRTSLAAAAASVALLAASPAAMGSITSSDVPPAASATPTGEGRIIGGEEIHNNRDNPGAVVLSSNGSQFCSAVRIAPKWVLSARHCDSPITGVFTQNVRSMTGPEASVRRVIKVPVGDTILIELADTTPGPVAAWTDVEPRKGSSVYMYGYGKPQQENERPSRILKRARGEVDYYYEGFYGGRTVVINCRTGCTMRGDSGGPMFHDGRAAAVLSSGNADQQGKPFDEAVSGYTMLRQNARWIEQTSGVAPNGRGYWFDGNSAIPTTGPTTPGPTTPGPTTPGPTTPGPGTGNDYEKSVNEPLNDYQTVTSVISSSTQSARRVKVRINLNHSCMENLQIALTAPTGERLVLKRSSYSWRCTAWRGEKSESYPMSIPANGDWTLEISDNARRNTGTFNSWGLTFSG